MKKLWCTEGAVEFVELAASGVLEAVCLPPTCTMSIHSKTAPSLQDSGPKQMQLLWVIHCFAPLSQAFLRHTALGCNTLQTGLQHCKGQSSGRGPPLSLLARDTSCGMLLLLLWLNNTGPLPLASFPFLFFFQANLRSSVLWSPWLLHPDGKMICISYARSNHVTFLLCTENEMSWFNQLLIDVAT